MTLTSVASSRTTLFCLTEFTLRYDALDTQYKTQTVEQNTVFHRMSTLIIIKIIIIMRNYNRWQTQQTRTELKDTCRTEKLKTV